MPRSRLSHAINIIPKNEFVTPVGKKGSLICSNYVKKISPLVVPVDTVKFKIIKNPTSRIPTTIIVGTIAKIIKLEHSLQLDVPRLG